MKLSTICLSGRGLVGLLIRCVDDVVDNVIHNVVDKMLIILLILLLLSCC